MTKRQNQKLAMYMAVLNTLRQQAAEEPMAPAVGALIKELEQLIAEINAATRIRAAETIGVTDAKTAVRQLLDEKAFIIGRAIAVYALQQGDTLLAAGMDRALYEFRSVASNLALVKAEQVLLAAKELGDALVSYGVNAAHLEELELLLEEFRSQVSQPRLAINRRRKGTLALDALYRKTDGILGLLDRLMEGYRGTGAYQLYRSARKLVGAPRPKAPVAPDNSLGLLSMAIRA